jgi:hypothetical protein
MVVNIDLEMSPYEVWALGIYYMHDVHVGP